jgi:predicted ATP-dependent Lon-type protease
MAIKKFDELDKKLMSKFNEEKIVCPKNVLAAGVKLEDNIFEHLLSNMGISKNITVENFSKNIDKIKEKTSCFYSSHDAEKIKYEIITNSKNDKSTLVIDKIKVRFDDKSGEHFAKLLNIDLNEVLILDEDLKKVKSTLSNSDWCELELKYVVTGEDDDNYFQVDKITPLFITDIDNINSLEYKKKWNNFNLEERIEIILRSIGVEPTSVKLKEKYQEFLDKSSSNKITDCYKNSEIRAKLHLIIRLIPYVEKNYNLVEIGEKGIGKTHFHTLSKEAIHHSISDVTYSKLFGDKRYSYNTAEVGKKDVICLDEIDKGDFKKKIIANMNTYLTNGYYEKGSKNNSDKISANTSFVLTGNNEKNIEVLVARSIYNLFTPIPGSIRNDDSVQDRINFYLPSWEIEEFKSDIKTKHLGLNKDFLFKLFHSLRNKNYQSKLDKYFEIKYGETERNELSIKKTVSGLIKILNISDRSVTQEELELYLKIAIEGRNRVIYQNQKANDGEYEIIYQRKSYGGQIHHKPLENTIFYTDDQDELESSEIKLINEEEANQINLELYIKLKSVLRFGEEVIVFNNRKEFFDSDVSSFNFELVIRDHNHNIRFSKYNNTQKPRMPSREIETIFEEIGSKLGINNENYYLIDSYIKTYTILQDKLKSLVREHPFIQKELNLRADRSEKIRERDLEKLDFDFKLTDQIKPKLLYNYDYKENLDRLICYYGGLDLCLEWDTQNENKKYIYYNLNRDVLNAVGQY